MSESQVLSRAGSVIRAVGYVGLSTALIYKLHEWFYGGNSTLIRSFFLKLNLLTLLYYVRSELLAPAAFQSPTKLRCFVFTCNFFSPIKTNQPLRKAHFLLWIIKESFCISSYVLFLSVKYKEPYIIRHKISKNNKGRLLLGGTRSWAWQGRQRQLSHWQFMIFQLMKNKGLKQLSQFLCLQIALLCNVGF